MKNSSLFGFGALEGERQRAAEATRQREARLKQEDEGVGGTSDFEFPSSFVDERERTIACLGINSTFTDDLAHVISRADDSGQPQSFSTVSSRYGTQVAAILNAKKVTELGQILGRKVERHGGGYTFYPHRSVLSGVVKKVPSISAAA